MTFADALVAFVIAAVIALAVIKIVIERRKGAKCATCVGCPYSGSCEKHEK